MQTAKSERKILYQMAAKEKQYKKHSITFNMFFESSKSMSISTNMSTLKNKTIYYRFYVFTQVICVTIRFT